MTGTTAVDWKRRLRGAFAFQTAPFAIHPNDERHAVAAISVAIRAGASKAELESEIKRYLSDQGCAVAHITYQLKLFRSFFGNMYNQIRNCWVLSRPQSHIEVFVAIFSGRMSFDNVLYHSMYIYQSWEMNQASQFMRAKKKSWPIFGVNLHKFEGGGLWEGRASIGYDPEYTLVRADAMLSKNLDPESVVVWKAKPIPNDPGPTWHDLRYRE